MSGNWDEGQGRAAAGGKRGKVEPRAMPTDRLPPHSSEAEQGLLGCIMLAPEDALNQCEEAGIETEWFYDLRHQTIFHHARTLHKAGGKVDTITLFEALKAAQAAEQVGGLPYLCMLFEATASAANLPDYANLLYEKFVMRRVVRTGTEMVAAIYEKDPNLEEILGTAERDILKLNETRTGNPERSTKAILPDVMAKLEKYHRGSAQMRGMETGLEYLDKMLLGLGGDNGNFNVISARPGTGKTAIAVDIMLHAALDLKWFTPKPGTEGEKVEWLEHRGVPVMIFSLEMTSDSLVNRMLFQRSGADMQRWRTGLALAEDTPKLAKTAAELTKAKFWIDDSGRCSIEQLRARARRMHRQHGIKLFVIDYIQLLNSTSRRYSGDARVQELSDISGQIQALGKELGVPFIVLAQMNRDYEKEPNREPRMSDLKDCGAIEQDADVIMFLSETKTTGSNKREKDAEEFEAMAKAIYGDDWSKHPKRIDMLVAKNRHGPTGKVELIFEKWCTRFEDFNVWKKKHKFKDLAMGEREPTRRDDLPTDDEIGREKMD